MNSSGPAVCVTHADTMATAAAPETVISTGFISPASCTQNPLPKKNHTWFNLVQEQDTVVQGLG